LAFYSRREHRRAWRWIRTALILLIAISGQVGQITQSHRPWSAGQDTGAIDVWARGVWAASTFLIMNRAMESAGWVVGAPRAAERFTMLTVMFAGDLGAAIGGGALMAWTLAKPRAV